MGRDALVGNTDVLEDLAVLLLRPFLLVRFSTLWLWAITCHFLWCECPLARVNPTSPWSSPLRSQFLGAASELWICSGPGRPCHGLHEPSMIKPPNPWHGQVSSPACSPRGSSMLSRELAVLWFPPASTVLGWEEQTLLLLDGLRPREEPCPESLSRWSVGRRAEPSLTCCSALWGSRGPLPFPKVLGSALPSPLLRSRCYVLSAASPVLTLSLRSSRWLSVSSDKNRGRTSRTEWWGCVDLTGLWASQLASLLTSLAGPCFYPEKLRTF